MQSVILLLVAAPFIGSFLGLLIERLPHGASVVRGRSACQACGTVLGPRDLVPLLSGAASGWRCRHCRVSLGWFHPAIELAALGVAVWSVAAVPAWLAWPTAGLGWALLVLAVIDHRHMILPDALTYPLIAAGLGIAAAGMTGAPGAHLAGAAIGGAGLAAIGWAYHRATGREGLGLGDAKLMAAAGAWLGWQGLASVLLIGSAAGLVAVLGLATLHGPGRLREPVAFGPFLAAGLWITWLYGPVQGLPG